jgi:translocation and assembly module TamA
MIARSCDVDAVTRLCVAGRPPCGNLAGILAPTPTPRPRRHWFPLAIALLLIGRAPAHSADPVHYAVTIAATGQDDLDAAVRASATLISLRDSVPVGPFALAARARSDAQRFATVLGSLGYYDGRAAVTIIARPVDDPGLPEALDAVPDTTEVPVAVTLTLGPLFHLRHIVLQGEVPAAVAEKLGLSPGMPARAADVLAAHDRLLQALLSDGYALATVAAPQATLDGVDDALDVSMAVTPGPRVDLGRISVNGLTRLHEDFVRRRLTVHEGERFDPAKLEATRQDLAATGVLAEVRITPADRLDAEGRLPVRLDLTERPRHAVNLSAGWSTDEGGNLGASWTDRNLFGGAEQLTLNAAGTGLGGSAEKQPGYNLGAILTIPDWRRRDQTLTISATGVREYLEAYDRTALLSSVTLSRKLAEHLTGSIGVAGEEAHIKQEDVTHDYTLVQTPVGLTWNSSDSLLDPTKGFRAAATVTPTASLGNAGDRVFVIAQASASAYVDFGTKGRTVLAVRGLVGGLESAEVFAIPPDQRFYGGGGGTIRGYRYQSVGPKFADGNPTGGTAIDVGSVELRQRIGTSWGGVVFVDAGQVGATGVPFSGNLGVGAGVGGRYYTAFGPIRLDVAVPLVSERKNDVIDVYIGIGQAF